MTHSCSPSRRSHDRVHAPHHWRGGDERERERGGLKIGRSDRSRMIWAAVKGPQCWGRKWRLEALLLTPPTTRGKRSAFTKTKRQPHSVAVAALRSLYGRPDCCSGSIDLPASCPSLSLPPSPIEANAFSHCDASSTSPSKSLRPKSSSSSLFKPTRTDPNPGKLRARPSPRARSRPLKRGRQRIRRGS